MTDDDPLPDFLDLLEDHVRDVRYSRMMQMDYRTLSMMLRATLSRYPRSKLKTEISKLLERYNGHTASKDHDR